MANNDKRDHIREFMEVLAELQSPISPEDEAAMGMHPEGEDMHPAAIAGAEDEIEDTTEYIRIAHIFASTPNSPSSHKMEAALRRLMTGEHLTHEYSELLNQMFRMTVEAVMVDSNLFHRLRHVFKNRGIQ